MFKKFLKIVSTLIITTLMCINVYAHQYSNLDSYKWMVEDCRQMRIGLNAQGVSMNVDNVYTYKTNDYRYYYYVISSGFFNKSYVHVYACRKNATGTRIDLKAYDSLAYEIGDTSEDTEVKKNLSIMKSKDLAIDHEILLNLRVDMGN